MIRDHFALLRPPVSSGFTLIELVVVMVVVGIVAARLKEATHRPAVVIGLEGGIGKGSGRSIAGIDLGAAIHRLASEGHLEKGGGHRMAAGLQRFHQAKFLLGRDPGENGGVFGDIEEFLIGKLFQCAS